MANDDRPALPRSTPDLLALSLNLPFLDELYEQYKRDRASVDPSWLPIFDAQGQGQVAGKAQANGHAVHGVQIEPAASKSNGNGHAHAALRGLAPAVIPAYDVPETMHRIDAPVDGGLRLDKVRALVSAYRTRGHLEADLDPLKHVPRKPHPDLDPGTYNFHEHDFDREVITAGLYGVERAPLRELIRRLRATYCRTIGVELMHISQPEKRAWLEERMEPTLNEPSIDRDTKLRILEQLTAAEAFERFVHVRFQGAKRFSLEGGEALIPLLDLALERAALHGVRETVIGMAHRGRLSVLATIMGKSAGDIFTEFEDVDPMSVLGGGDVKYHLGYSCDRETRTGDKMHLSLAFNPSHLEAVDPVVVGRVRAKQRRFADGEHRHVLGILIHGDAAFSGQGLVPETLNLADLQGYRTGGTLHIIVNNQIGFTTNPSAGRSTPYCTDVAKGMEVPIFHVNGDDPEAVAHVVRLAMDYRREFRSDVVIDMFCYRRWGHNEGDEPSFTQPLLYQLIERHPPLRELYARRLVAEGAIAEDHPEKLIARRRELFEAELSKAKAAQARPLVNMGGGVWAGYMGGPDKSVPEVDTGVARERLALIAERMTTLPPGFHPHKKADALLEQRRKMGRGELALDWAMGEGLAFGSLVDEGTLVRVSGQDCRRGTFSQRHALVVDVENGNEWIPLSHVREGQAPFRIYDSPLSEAAVLGFEFGYSLDYPDGLVVWEAQFGDFVNGAQVILDQFISSSEDKWRRISGLTLMLPHGYEGQGPEHSSARFERFLQLAAEDNIQVCQPTNAAQIFHLLRRQVLRKWRKPLIIMTPKSLLRLPAAKSELDALTTGRFQRVMDDAVANEGAVRRVLLCTGKVCYDLIEERKKRGDEGVAIVRVEQLYPLADEELKAVVDRYVNATEVVWVQDEPANMGGRTFMLPKLWRIREGRKLHAVTRVESASPATGSHHAHQIEQARLMEEAFGPLTDAFGQS